VKKILVDGQKPWEVGTFEVGLQGYPATAAKRPGAPRKKK